MDPRYEPSAEYFGDVAASLRQPHLSGMATVSQVMALHQLWHEKGQARGLTSWARMMWQLMSWQVQVLTWGLEPPVVLME